MKAFFTLMVFGLLSCSVIAADEITSTPESVAVAATIDLNTGRLEEAVALFHPEALARIKQMTVNVAQTTRDAADLQSALAQLGVSSVSGLDALPPEKLALAVFTVTDAKKPAAMKNIMRNASYKSLGTVINGDTAYVVLLTTAHIAGAEKKMIVAVAAKKAGSRWMYVGSEI